MGKVHLKKHLPLLQFLSKAKPKINRAIIEESGPEVIRVLSECACNTLKGNVPLTQAQKNKLRRYKNHLRNLAEKKRVGIKKKKVILQQGGFLPALLGAILPAITAAFGLQ